MRRAAPLAVAALLVLSTAARAEDPVDALDVDLARWEASDAEARWVMVRSTGTPDAWVAFLAQRKEHGLLEWLALAESATGALDALFAADDPRWPRVALWSDATADTHKVEGARSLLVQRRPGLALDWLERHPAAAAEEPGKSILAELRKAAPAREDAARMLPPLVAGEVLAALSVGANPVDDLGERREAEPGRVYASQVVRAIDVLATSRLREDPWRGRLLALLRNPDPGVRRKAALALSHFPAASIPVDDLLARVDDAQEDPGVRAAAAVGLSGSSEPRAYLTLLRLARDPVHPAWQAAISRLGDLGDGFALERLREVAAPDPVGALHLEQARRSIDLRWRQETADPAVLAQRIPALLGRAAWVDLTCDPLEATLVPWTTALLEAHAKHDAVRAALERVLSEEPPELAGTAREGSVLDRARSYARAALRH